jgi:mannose/fructose/N-acetylgalactosamine-specific phosphotransferase system component IIB
VNTVLVRVDDRLIHGQILESWLPTLKAQVVVVANDTLAHDQFQRAILSMAIPERITLSIVPIEDIRQLEDEKDLSGKTTLIIVSSITDAFRLHACGLSFQKLNIGNVRGDPTGMQLSYSVWLTPDDIEKIRLLIDAGIFVTLQSVPREREVDVKGILP